MRIIAGLCRGITLQNFYHSDIRPTKDIVKESMFNSLMTLLDFPQCDVCDLFAGTGNLGIEALSRGAHQAVFVESNPLAVDLIYQNLKKTKLEANALVNHQDVIRFLDQPAKQPFDLILADPPYRLKLSNFIIEKLISNNYLKSSAVMVLETAPEETITIEPYHNNLQIHKNKKFGESLVTILKYNVY